MIITGELFAAVLMYYSGPATLIIVGLLLWERRKRGW
jgi:hypothetical protein